MCGRFIILSDPEQLQLAFHLDQVPAQVKSSYNIAPTQTVAAVVQRNGHNVLEPMRWGLIPAWAKDARRGALINARAETVAEKASFKPLLQHQRCLVIADGFYEWQTANAQKIPMFIRLNPPEPFAFAGVYAVWQAPTGEAITSCSIITTRPNALLAPIHDRMPVILPRTAHGAWLDPANQNMAALVALLQPYPAEQMTAWRVSPQVNAPQHNSADLIRPM